MFDGKPSVINSHLVHNGRIEVTNMYWIFENVVTKLVGFSVCHSALDATAGHPHAIALRMMITTIVGFTKGTLAVNSTAKFTTVNYEGVIEQSTLF